MASGGPLELVSIKGLLMPAREVPCPQGDLGWLRGYGVYETLQVYPKGVFELDAHLDRLEESSALLRIAMPARSQLREALDAWRSAAGLERGRARIVLLPDGTGSWWMIEGEKLPPRPRVGTTGLKIWVTRLTVPPPPLGIAKTISRVAYELAGIEAKEQGAEDAILPTVGGDLGESTRASVFFVDRGRLKTPPLSLGILPGVTRSVLLADMPGRGQPIVEETIPMARVFDVEEMFLTSTVRGIAPVTELIGPGGQRKVLEVGPMARRADEVLRDRIARSGLDS